MVSNLFTVRFVTVPSLRCQMHKNNLHYPKPKSCQFFLALYYGCRLQILSLLGKEVTNYLVVRLPLKINYNEFWMKHMSFATYHEFFTVITLIKCLNLPFYISFNFKNNITYHIYIYMVSKQVVLNLNFVFILFFI